MPEAGSDRASPSLCAAFRHERARTDDLLARAACLGEVGPWPEALVAFEALDRRLRARIRRAEDLVLPLFEIKAGSASELTRTLVNEHREIEGALEALGTCLRERHLDDVEGRVRDLRRILEEHDGRRSRLVFPLLDRLLTDEERRRLLAGDEEDAC
jgi:hypothetical protein